MPELIYEYQMHSKTLNEVLKADLDAMKNFNQPLLVNDELALSGLGDGRFWHRAHSRGWDHIERKR